MTVAELIEKLEKVEDKSKEVYVYSYDDWTLAGSVYEDEDVDYGYTNCIGII